MNDNDIDKAMRELAKEVAPIYVFLNWTWWPLERVPTEEEIYKKIARLYKNLKRRPFKDVVSISTGGLTVHRYKDELKEIHYQFSFGIEREI